MGRAKSRTSLTMRFSRVTSSSMSATASRSAASPGSPCRSVWSDALMIINGLRISWAITVDRRPSDVRRSFCEISRWNRTIESVNVLNVVARSRASSSSHLFP